ncbi:hypothetical protein CANMA_001667 [Candida margitis]|uniref:uncharacterized protein n=1 Tax=Candida margitis TaxID=1775924 RepID=UPI002225C94F|nr:uncharacterized protein CANMA_002832 [Candida margitis]XP_051672773.1 uncharacterized protein CANMA_001667 [Candida margitis]KAI5967652.1 hypothetical protein CANMA_002832 [Candida margitis]KAI5969347.1 hypothetical protein CANMA_001667 [Candida margitis]
MCLISKVSIFLFFALTSVLAFHHPPQEEHPIFKITSNTHDKTTIIGFLQDVANKIAVSPAQLNRFYQGTNSLSSSSPTKEDKKCLENTIIKFYIRSLKLTDHIYEASECRINLNPRMQSILQPTPNIHNLLLRDNDMLDTQLKYVLMDEFNRYQQFKDYKFNDFQHLNYDLSCIIDYQELMQVELMETVVEANLERKVEVDEACGLSILNQNFIGTSIDYITTQVPINGTFYCKKGRSSTCNRAIADSSNARYRLPEY